MKKIFNITGYLILAVFVIVTLAFTSNESRDVSCKKIEIEIDPDEVIKISSAEIIRLVNSSDPQLMGKKLKNINTEIIETEVEKHQAILKAEVYTIVAKDSTSYKGILGVNVKHREPVMRVMSSSGTYYLDKFKGKIPVSMNYTANVLVATGNFTEKYAKDQLLPFILYVEKDEFWNAQVEQVHVEKNGDIILTPLVGDHFIELGKIADFESKLRNMKAFYKQVLANNNWNKYKSVSLKYKNQVVAKRR